MNINKEYDEGRIPSNQAIFNSFMVMDHKINDKNKIVVSISGGSDSDLLIDMFCKFDTSKIDFVFFDTGLEYRATWEHIKYLEEKYGVKIKVIKAKKPIPLTCKRHGEPFLSKNVSENISRLQKHGFKWEDKPYDELVKEYPNCKCALKWWCNEYDKSDRFNIRYNKLLKEFMIANPPNFNISSKCCQYAKKDLIHNLVKKEKYDLNVCGVRKSEGGVRATAYKNCFSDNSAKGKADEYRPLFWYKDDDKKDYEDFYGIEHSKCYTEYGLKRTGCAGCPFGNNFEYELEVIEKYEPKLFKAVNNIFKNSYEYTRAYRKFVKENSKKRKDI